jgi:hypothetical protein
MRSGGGAKLCSQSFEPEFHRAVSQNAGKSTLCDVLALAPVGSALDYLSRQAEVMVGGGWWVRFPLGGPNNFQYYDERLTCYAPHSTGPQAQEDSRCWKSILGSMTYRRYSFARCLYEGIEQ